LQHLGLLTEYNPQSDQRILDITVLDLLQHSSGWDHRTIGDPLFMLPLHKVRSGESMHSTVESAIVKDTMVRFMMNQTLQYKPGMHTSVLVQVFLEKCALMANRSVAAFHISPQI
jgi:hypothetical protein